MDKLQLKDWKKKNIVNGRIYSLPVAQTFESGVHGVQLLTGSSM